MAEGLPDQIRNQTAIIPAGRTNGYVTFELPLTLPPEHYSFVIRAEQLCRRLTRKTEKRRRAQFAGGDRGPAGGRLEVGVDPFCVTKARRGETISSAYSRAAVMVFIGKMHTDLPRRESSPMFPVCWTSETFTGQTETGSLADCCEIKTLRWAHSDSCDCLLSALWRMSHCFTAAVFFRWRS